MRGNSILIEMETIPYLSGEDPGGSLPLERYLPAVPLGAASAFLAGHEINSPWILDPFGAAPSMAVEMVRSGKQVLVAVNNPIMRFLYELAAAPPQPSELQVALAELASTRKGDERLETHLQSLYMTECTKCKRQVQAEAFIWEKGAAAPAGRIYHCSCGESGEFPTAASDALLAARLAATDSLHRARALEFVTAHDDPDREFAERALDCYLPRAVYALVTIITKLNGPSLAAGHRRALNALVLAILDEANTLWPYPTERPRPRQLTIPTRFIEKNIWLALENVVANWKTTPPVQTQTWNASESLPYVSADGGSIYVFEGPLRILSPAIPALQPGAVVTALPRPNQAFWTLSVLWAGWLWGRKTAATFKSMLRRRRYDWDWHAAALHAAMKHLSSQLSLNAPFFAMIPEPEPPFLSAALRAADGAGFDLDGLALRTRHDPVQVVWRRRAFLREDKPAAEVDLQVVQEAIQTCLIERGEPVSYLHLHAAALQAMADDSSLGWSEAPLSTLDVSIQQALANPLFTHLSECTNPESGFWSLSSWQTLEPLPDRVEIILVSFLHQNPGSSFKGILSHLSHSFPGLFTPSLALTRAILASYGVEENGGWTLRPEDAPSARLADLEAATQSLTELASRLGYTSVSKKEPWRTIHWMEAGDRVYAFNLVASAVVGKILRSVTGPAGKSVLVLPGGRAGLLAYKLERIPDLRSSLEHWRVVKFRHLRSLLDTHNLTREVWDREMTSDPLEKPEQMKLF